MINKTQNDIIEGLTEHLDAYGRANTPVTASKLAKVTYDYIISQGYVPKDVVDEVVLALGDMTMAVTHYRQMLGGFKHPQQQKNWVRAKEALANYHKKTGGA